MAVHCINKPAGTKGQKHSIVEWGGKAYHLHVLIFIFHYGYRPLVVDHKDRNPRNNRIENLRAASYWLNSVNNTARKNISGRRGVTVRGKWYETRIRHKNKLIYLGRFRDKEDAANAFLEMAKRLRGKYAAST